jgi:hypothetical protein
LEIITYSLRDEQGRSDQYYRDIAAFTGATLREAETHAGLLVTEFRSFLEETGREELRTREEYALELLVLGILSRVYGPRKDLGGRGALSLAQLDELLDRLAAADAFEQEVLRLRAWRDFWVGRPAAGEELGIVRDLGAWFEGASLAALGPYTPNVERFLAKTFPRYRGRHDQVLCGRRRVEYHLNMAGVEILNRAFRPAFLATARKLVLVPPCMRAQPEESCRATQSEFGAQCAGCTPGCRIHQLTKLGEKHGFAVRMLPDELRVLSSGTTHGPSTPLRAGLGDAQAGIVGVACALTDIAGGWELRALGVPAQGLLLDYCGCPWHWHPEGIRTDTNYNELLRLLE